jgi:hypothetical protein
MSKSNVICSKVHDGRAFSWQGRHGVIEISTLGDAPFCHVYNDACDLGFGVQGKDRIITFRVDSPIVQDDGELAGWHMTSIDARGFAITVFND